MPIEFRLIREIHVNQNQSRFFNSYFPAFLIRFFEAWRLVNFTLAGLLFAFWAIPTMTVAHLVFALMTTAYILVAIRLEERDLVAFHPEYAEYRRRVPMLVPVPSTRRPA